VATDDAMATLGRMLRLATESSAPAEVVTAAWDAMHRPIGLVDSHGRALAAMPSGVAGEQAIWAASGELLGTSPPGHARWIFQPVSREGTRLGMLSMSADPAPSRSHARMLELVSSLCGAQLHRAGLERAVVARQQAHLRRRTVTSPGLSRHSLVRKARTAGQCLAGCYWPSLVWWSHGDLAEPSLRRLRSVATSDGQQRSVLIPLEARVLVLLFADRAAGDERRGEVQRWVAKVVHAARGFAGLAGVHVLAANGSVPADDVAGTVDSLMRLRHCQARPWAGGRVPEARAYALELLLGETLDPDGARAFVMQRAGRLLAHDRQHGTDLARTLELALDHPHRDEAALVGSMHRNTLRRKVRRAVELVDADPDDPNDRLALHVALRLARLLGLMVLVSAT
jgi:PucR C-terminal helix-turn-helix domain